MGMNLPQTFKIAEVIKPATDAAGRTGAYVSLKTGIKATIVFHVQQGNAATILVSVLQAKDVSGTSSKAITNVVPIWRNLDTAASDTLVRDTDAKTYTTDAGVKNKYVVFEIIPELHMDIANGFNTITISTGASNAANLTEASVYVETNYAQATPPSVIVN